MQGMLRPFTPAGMSVLDQATAQWLQEFGGRGSMGIVAIGGRLYIDLTAVLRSRWMRDRLPAMLEVYGPRCVHVAERLLRDARFAPGEALPLRPGPALTLLGRLLPQAVAGVVRALARPQRARRRAFRCAERLRGLAVAPEGLSSAERLRWIEQAQRPFLGAESGDLMWALMAGILVGRLPRTLLRGIGTDAEFETALGGLPHNVTTEMDLALWGLAAVQGESERELLLGTPPAQLARKYLAGELPEIGLGDFLARYGHRAAGEIDVGVPRWAEDPAPIFATLAGYLRQTDPQQAPDRRFRRAAERAGATIGELLDRARRTRPVRARLARFCFARSRELTGLRELGKFAWLHPLAGIRRELLRIGADLVAQGLLEEAADVLFLELPEVRAALAGADHRRLIAERKSSHARELRRRHVPIALLSDGTDLEAADPPRDGSGGVLTGMSAAPGRATGRARVVLDPAGARVEPGEILVAPTTDPGWTPLFLTAAGLVTETGSPMAHGPTVAREYGIPAVICVRAATERIRTGDPITLDGTAGTVSPAAEPSEQDDR